MSIRKYLIVPVTASILSLGLVGCSEEQTKGLDSSQDIISTEVSAATLKSVSEVDNDKLFQYAKAISVTNMHLKEHFSTLHTYIHEAVTVGVKGNSEAYDREVAKVEQAYTTLLTYTPPSGQEETYDRYLTTLEEILGVTDAVQTQVDEAGVIDQSYLESFERAVSEFEYLEEQTYEVAQVTNAKRKK